jgi:hypothetical protein
MGWRMNVRWLVYGCEMVYDCEMVYECDTVVNIPRIEPQQVDLHRHGRAGVQIIPLPLCSV